jgi:hypothetical protein
MELVRSSFICLFRSVIFLFLSFRTVGVYIEGIGSVVRFSAFFLLKKTKKYYQNFRTEVLHLPVETRSGCPLNIKNRCDMFSSD